MQENKNLTPQEEFQMLQKRNAELNKIKKEKLSELASFEKKIKIMKNLCDTLNASKSKLLEQLNQMKDENNQKMIQIQQEKEKSLQSLKKTIEQNMIPYDQEKMQYEMVNARYQYLLESWENQKIEMENNIAETRYKTQMIKAKIKEVHSRIDKFKEPLKEKYQNLNFNVDVGDAMSALHPEQLKLELSAKTVQKQELEKICRELREKKISLTRSMEAKK